MSGPTLLPRTQSSKRGPTTVLDMRLYPLIVCLKALGESHWLTSCYLFNGRSNLTLPGKRLDPTFGHSRVLVLSQSVRGLGVTVESWFNVQGSGRAFVPDFEQRLMGLSDFVILLRHILGTQVDHDLQCYRGLCLEVNIEWLQGMKKQS